MKTELRAACLGAALAGTWTACDASPVNYVVVEELTTALDFVTGFYQYNASGGDGSIVTTGISYGTLGALATGSYILDVPDDKYANQLNTAEPYTIIGLYNEGGEDHVVIGLSPTDASNAISNQLTFDGVFVPALSYPRTEADLVDSIKNGLYDPYGFGEYFGLNQKFFPSFNQDAVLVSFSQAKQVGTMHAYAPANVPSPASWSLVALGFGLIAATTRRRLRSAF